MEKYEVTVSEIDIVLDWLYSEMRVQSIQSPAEKHADLDMDYIYNEVMSRLYEEIHQGLVNNVADID